MPQIAHLFSKSSFDELVLDALPPAEQALARPSRRNVQLFIILMPLRVRFGILNLTFRLRRRAATHFPGMLSKNSTGFRDGKVPGIAKQAHQV
ncbi:MAG: hypothetical protein ABI612_21605 [Betaproteobacteria bacterium]